jgi:drug/metabolite transporter (DMT)-like permease
LLELGAPINAVVASVSFAASQVMTRRGLVHTPVIVGVMISLSCALLGAGIFVAVDPPAEIEGGALALFVVGGLAAPGVSRWASAMGIRMLGPSVAVPLAQGARPILSVTAAVVLLGETFTSLQVFGLATIIGGGWELSRVRKGKADQEPETEVMSKVERLRKSVRPGIAFPLGAALAFATSDVFMKEGLARMDHPGFATLAAMGSALVVWLLIAAMVPKVRGEMKVGRDVGWLIASGLINGFALINLNSALEAGDLTTVAPIIAAQPLAVVVFSRVLLRDLEHLTPAVVLAGAAVVVGTIIITL